MFLVYEEKAQLQYALFSGLTGDGAKNGRGNVKAMRRVKMPKLQKYGTNAMEQA